MYNWFQNIKKEDNASKLFHFRGSVGKSWDKNWFSYELVSGPALDFEIETHNSKKTSFQLGLIFFKVFLTIYGLRLPFLKPSRYYGFRTFDWRFWFHFNGRKHERRATDPWYYDFNIDPLELLFGKTIFFESVVFSSTRPVYFRFRGQIYEMNNVQVEKRYWFKPRIPFSLWHRTVTAMEVDCENPPKYQGKGENSWDQGDDGTYGLSCPYEGPTPKFSNRHEVMEHCCYKYCVKVAKEIKKRGRVSEDTLPVDYWDFECLGYESGEG